MPGSQMPTPQPSMPQKLPRADDQDIESVNNLRAAYTTIKAELAKVIVGQQEVVDEILISIFTRSHALLVGVPGLAKTLLISTLAKTMQMSFRRIQFTPDLMPSDITGTEVIYQDPATGEKAFKFLQGPLFANIVLADEVNRTPPKTQAALLEAMQERQGTGGGTPHRPRTPATGSVTRSSCWRPRTRSSRREPTRCRRPSRTGSCSRCTSSTRRSRRSS